MTKTRKLAIISLLVCFVLSSALAFGITASGPKTAMAAEQTEVSHYFYNQLSAEQKAFYEAMEKMHTQGLFISGEDYDLVANGYVTQTQLEAFANGDQTILKVMAGARDAFYTDYNDIFYVDFGALSLRVTQSSDGKYHAWLGAGRYDTYYVKGLTNATEVRAAIEEYKTARDAVVAKALAAKPTDDQIKALGLELATTVEQLRVAHAEIALSSVYRLETTCTPGNEGHIRTPYGVFVKGQALCEGYSRAFKAICDELGVPCVLVNGVYRHGENQQEIHMWCHVELEGSWYAVDQTFDDVNGTKPWQAVQTGEEYNYEYTEDYFLKGASFMNTNHATSPYKSEAEYPFSYPELTESNLGSQSSAHGLFYIKQDPHTTDMNSTDITVSVFLDGEWCGYRDAAKKGYYIVMRHEGDYLPELRARSGDLSQFDDNGAYIGNTMLTWGYLNPVAGMYDGLIDEFDGYTIIRNESKSTGFEFAVTTIPPREYIPDYKDQYTAEQAAEMFTYLGDQTMFTARSGLIETLYGDPNYQPAPHIVRSTPTHLTKLLIQKGLTYNVTVEYDQVLELIPNEDGSLPELQVSVYGLRADGEILKGTNAVTIDVVSNISWTSGVLNSQEFKGGTVSFDFTPSIMYAHDNVLYMFDFNLRGVNSKRQINTIEYAASYPCDAMCYKANGFHWSVFAQPQLLENDDLSKEGWVSSDGTDVSQAKDRLALVVTKPSAKQDNTMNSMLEGELGLDHQSDGELQEGAFESFTFNIQLTICKGVILETGQGIRIGVGFPEGFTYDDSLNGVTFTAYHFIHDKQNNITGVEEIECTVTPLGLILMVHSFSPFAIVVKHGEPEADLDKTVILSASQGGTAYAEVDVKNEDGTTTKTNSNLFAVKQGEKPTLEVIANEGYVIESVKVGENIYLSNSANVMTISLDYDSLDVQTIVSVNFVAATVKAAEEKRGESVVVQEIADAVVKEIKNATINLATKSVSVEAGQEVKLEATVVEPQDADSNSYQWYKDGKAIAGQTGATLTIEKAQASDSGEYTLLVTSTYGASNAIAISETVNVKVAGAETDSPKPNPAPVVPGDKDPAKTGMTTVEKAMLIIAGGVGVLGLIMIIVLIAVKRKRN
ncbi:MAG: immunoglobulin domain-containing protein [Clostridiales bacterium]|nr:immunoglobulin domain-containing protein [Clostridiales bacterium]